jgi:AraC-like DNA-binding protein
LHEAIEQLAQGGAPDRPVDWTAIALDLGYFDHAHFIRDFKRLVGRTPAEFVREEGTSRP